MVELAPRRPRTPWVAAAFLCACLVVTVGGLLLPGLRELTSGIAPRRHVWQTVTASLQHGWPGLHPLPHLALNALLILRVGFACERLLGWRRFLLLSAASALANAAQVSLSEGVNGSSLVIWAWGPPLFLALRARDRAPSRADLGATAAEIRGLLFVMYVAVTVAMTLLPYAAGWRGNPLVAFLLGNRWHLVATVVGAVFAVAWRGGPIHAGPRHPRVGD